MRWGPTPWASAPSGSGSATSWSCSPWAACWLPGGTDGLGAGVPPFFGYAPPREHLRVYQYYVILLVAGLAIYAVYRFLSSPLGDYLKARADNEIRIEHSGESVRRVIYFTYVFSGVLAGLSGGMAAFIVGQ